MAKARTPPIYTTPGDVALAFYHAFEARDVDAMMATWAEDEDIVCVHPGGTRMVGYDAVRAGWEQLFSGDTRLNFRLDQIVVIETVGLAMQSAVEHITLGKDGSPRGAAICTNVFPAHAVGLAARHAPRFAGARGVDARADGPPALGSTHRAPRQASIGSEARVTLECKCRPARALRPKRCRRR